MTPTKKPDRRTVLRVGAAGGVALVTLPLACGQDTATLPTGPVPAGNVSSVAVGALALVRGEALFLGRDANGLYAMSGVCTHASGAIENPSSATSGVVCPRHGSVFDRNGNVVQGPAFLSLQHFQVDVASDGSITIQAGMPVAADARTAV
jgi:nitrite reductase/ring-hydroxylating ferredoxin subunit